MGDNQLSAAARPLPSYGWSDCFALLKGFGFAPRAILDVGANQGRWTRAALEFFPEASCLLVEPQEHLRVHVQDLLVHDSKVRWLTAGVSDCPGRLPLTLAPDEVSSTFLPTPDEAASWGMAQVTVDVRTIDEIVANECRACPEMVKIDAEGFDLKALAGASTLLGKTDLFFVEAAVCATRIENTMAAVVSRMTDAGYKLIDITDLNRSPKHGVLWLCELVFMRAGCPLLEKVASYQ